MNIEKIENFMAIQSKGLEMFLCRLGTNQQVMVTGQIKHLDNITQIPNYISMWGFEIL